MSDIGDAFKDTKHLRDAHSKQKRQSNLVSSTQILDKNNISYEVKNGGYHLVVKGKSLIADFWPSTGKFNVRGEPKYFRGVRLLIKIIRGDYTDNDLKSMEVSK